MSRKDYIALASVIHKAVAAVLDGEVLACIRVIADDIAEVCEDDNPRFDRARFMTACGLD